VVDVVTVWLQSEQLYCTGSGPKDGCWMTTVAGGGAAIMMMTSLVVVFQDEVRESIANFLGEVCVCYCLYT